MLCFAALCSIGFIFCLGGIMINLYIDNGYAKYFLNLVPYSGLGIGEDTFIH